MSIFLLLAACSSDIQLPNQRQPHHCRGMDIFVESESLVDEVMDGIVYWSRRGEPIGELTSDPRVAGITLAEVEVVDPDPRVVGLTLTWTDHCVVTVGPDRDPTTVTHELGHTLGHGHTFKGIMSVITPMRGHHD